MVWSITLHPHEIAAPWYRYLAVADLEQTYLPDLFPDGQYDYIIFADVLENICVIPSAPKPSSRPVPTA